MRLVFETFSYKISIHLFSMLSSGGVSWRVVLVKVLVLVLLMVG